jgi:predicted site-specific integrase-resolvase
VDQAWEDSHRLGRAEARVSRSEIERLVGKSDTGLKASRKQLQRLLKLVIEDQVAEIAMTEADWLTRFG